MRWITSSISLILWMAPLAAQEIKLPPDLAARANESVDVTLDSGLLQLAGRFLSDSKPDDAKAKRLIKGLKSISVKTFEFDRPGEYKDVDLDGIRAQFRGPNWSRVVGVHNRKSGEHTDIFLRTDSGGKIGGLAIIAAGSRELSIISIVGQIDPDDLRDLSGHFGIPKMDLEKEKRPGKDD